jgi:hypothetical protein
MAPERHSRRCLICQSEHRGEIEASYLNWEPPSGICRKFGIRSKTSLQSHVSALNLVEERDRMLKRCLGTLIEKNLNRRLSGAALIAAIVALSKLDAEGRSAERLERTNEPTRFDGWTRGELNEFVMTGVRPERFRQSDV